MDKLTFLDLPKLSFEVPTNPYSLDSMLILNRHGIELDFDVYLPKFGVNLQRPYVWTDEQASALIMSILLDKPIMPCCINCNYDSNKFEIIDGKQRLMSLIRFMNNEFPLLVANSSGGYDKYMYDDLDKSMQTRLNLYSFKAYEHFEHNNIPSTILTDEQKIEWFLFINNTGTPPNDGHIAALANLIEAAV